MEPWPFWLWISSVPLCCSIRRRQIARPKGGAGLGLAICRRLIEQHNGTLEIQSQKGHGSTVNVVLPAA